MWLNYSHHEVCVTGSHQSRSKLMPGQQHHQLQLMSVQLPGCGWSFRLTHIWMKCCCGWGSYKFWLLFHDVAYQQGTIQDQHFDIIDVGCLSMISLDHKSENPSNLWQEDINSGTDEATEFLRMSEWNWKNMLDMGKRFHFSVRPFWSSINIWILCHLIDWTIARIQTKRIACFVETIYSIYL